MLVHYQKQRQIVCWRPTGRVWDGALPAGLRHLGQVNLDEMGGKAGRCVGVGVGVGMGVGRLAC